MYFCGMKQNSSMKQNKTKWTDTDVTDVFHKLSPAYVQELLQVFEFTYVRTKNFIDLSVFICTCMNRKEVKDEG